MATIDLDGGGSDGGTTEEVPGEAGEAKDATSSIGPIEGTARTSALMSVGISTCYAC